MDNLSIAKQEVKLIDLIPGNKRKIGKYISVNPCPVCGHKDHFFITENNNCFFSASKCNKGGTVIDWLMIFEKITSKEAIDKLLNLTNRKEKISFNQVRKIKAKQIENQNKKKKLENITTLCYHKLTLMEKALRNIEKDSFLNWLYDFISNYTTLFVLAEDVFSRQKLCNQFKDDLNMSYDNFLSYEKKIINWSNENENK